MTTTTLPALPVAPAGSGITYHRWTGLDDLPGMAAANARLRARCGLLEPVDVEAMHHRYTHLVNSDPLTDCIIARRDGVTVGYARTEWHDLTDGDRVFDFTSVVEPDAWGLGITEAFVAWCEDRLRQTAAGIPGDRRAWFGTGVFDGDTELEGVLLERGYDGRPLGRGDAPRHDGRPPGRPSPPARLRDPAGPARPDPGCRRDAGRGLPRALGRARGERRRHP